jgi:cell division protease FtsH
MDEEQLSARDFGTAFKNFLEGAATGLPAQEPDLAPRIRAHLGAEPRSLPVVTRQFAMTDRLNVQVALDALTSAEGRTVEMVGISSAYLGFEGTSISRLVNS